MLMPTFGSRISATREMFSSTWVTLFCIFRGMPFSMRSSLGRAILLLSMVRLLGRVGWCCVRCRVAGSGITFQQRGDLAFMAQGDQPVDSRYHGVQQGVGFLFTQVVQALLEKGHFLLKQKVRRLIDIGHVAWAEAARGRQAGVAQQGPQAQRFGLVLIRYFVIVGRQEMAGAQL